MSAIHQGFHPGGLCPLQEIPSLKAPVLMMGLILRQDPYSLFLVPVHAMVQVAGPRDLVLSGKTNSLEVGLVLCPDLGGSFPSSAVKRPTASVHREFMDLVVSPLLQRQSPPEHPDFLFGLHFAPGSDEERRRQRLEAFWATLRQDRWKEALLKVSEKRSAAARAEDLRALAEMVPAVAALALERSRVAGQAQGDSNGMGAKSSALRHVPRPAILIEFETRLRRMGLEEDAITGCTSSDDLLEALPLLLALLGKSGKNSPPL